MLSIQRTTDGTQSQIAAPFNQVTFFKKKKNVVIYSRAGLHCQQSMQLKNKLHTQSTLAKTMPAKYTLAQR